MIKRVKGDDMLEFRNVTGNGKKFRLEDISFTAPTGYITGITGVNGAGKTTLFHCIVDKKCKYTGEILYNGENIRKDIEKFQNKIGFISDEKRFFTPLSVKDNIDLMSMFFDQWDNDLFYGKLKEWGIPVGRKLIDMSRGEYLKFQLALAMGHNATLYILDEATAGMDPVFRREFFGILHELIAREDITILMSTHIEEEIEVHMDYKVLLDGGRLVSCDEVEV